MLQNKNWKVFLKFKLILDEVPTETTFRHSGEGKATHREIYPESNEYQTKFELRLHYSIWCQINWKWVITMQILSNQTKLWLTFPDWFGIKWNSFWC